MNLDASFKEQDQALEREAELKPDKEKHQIDLVEVPGPGPSCVLCPGCRLFHSLVGYLVLTDIYNFFKHLFLQA